MKYWNTTDSSVVIDADGRVIDGGAYIDVDTTIDLSRPLAQAISSGTLIEVEVGDEYVTGETVNEPRHEDTDGEVEQDDTEAPSEESDPEATTLSTKTKAKAKQSRSQTQIKEK